MLGSCDVAPPFPAGLLEGLRSSEEVLETDIEVAFRGAMRQMRTLRSWDPLARSSGAEEEVEGFERGAKSRERTQSWWPVKEQTLENCREKHLSQRDPALMHEWDKRCFTDRFDTE